MNTENGSKVSVISAFWYAGISLVLALVFFLVTGEYDSTARYGGTIWVFILSMIITMPLVIPWIKKKYE